MTSFRRICLVVHRYTGLVLGIVTALIGLSGTILVFERELDAAMAPALFHVAAPGRDFVAASQIVAAAQAAAPEYRLRYLIRPNDDPQTTMQVFLGKRGAPDLQVFVDPYTGNVLGSRPATTWLQTLHRFHGELLAGKPGEALVGALALVLVLTLSLGLMLWWPSRGGWARALTVRWRSRGRVLQDVHNVSGAVTFVFLFVAALTALPLIWPQQTKAVLRVFAGATEQKPRHASVPADGARVDLDGAIAIAHAAVPNRWLNFVLPPFGPQGVYMVRTMPPAETTMAVSRTVYIDQYSGRVIDIGDPAQQHIVDTLAGDWSGTVHNGSALGWPGRLAMAAAGLVSAVLFATGAVSWARRRVRRVSSS
jgi:uncharacterized iron-regulated membrane protein